jgi:hypothetical protein
MSRSIHITIKNFKGLTKKEVKEQSEDPTSDLKQWSQKSIIKADVKKARKENKRKK